MERDKRIELKNQTENKETKKKRWKLPDKIAESDLNNKIIGKQTEQCGIGQKKKQA